MSRKGFTLIELLVVVAVLALLASIVFSNLGGAREGARISNALSFQSQTHSLLGSDLVGWWSFNEGDARDISGYGNNGNIIGATSAGGVPGTGGTAMQFNGSDQITIDNPLPGPNLEQEWTVSAWINVVDQGDTQYLVYGLNNNLRIFHGSGNRPLLYLNGGVDDYYTYGQSGAIKDDQWHLINFTFRNSDGLRRIYLDAVDISTGGPNHTSTPSGISNTLDIGRNVYGQIDDVRIYSRALTASEVQGLYAETKDKYLVEGR